MNPGLSLLIGILWVGGMIFVSVFQQLIDEGFFNFRSRGIRGALSGLAYWMGTEYCSIGEWAVGGIFFGVGTFFILWALLGRFPRSSAERLKCAFCGRHEKDVNKLIFGPLPICDDCMARVRAVLMSHEPASTPGATIEYVYREDFDVRCGFCRKRRYRVADMAQAGQARICGRCLEACELIAKRQDERAAKRDIAKHTTVQTRREALKQMIRSEGMARQYTCQDCGVKVSGKNLVRHFDRVHPMGSFRAS